MNEQANSFDVTSIGIRRRGFLVVESEPGRLWFCSGILRLPSLLTGEWLCLESCVVGVNELGSNPSRLFELMNSISDTNIRAQAYPFWLWMAIICLNIRCRSHCWIATRQLLTSQFVEGKRIVGNTTITMTVGRLIIIGVMEEENRFSLIWFLMGWCV